MKRMTLNAAELDKFIILSGAFGFTNNTLEQASKQELWSEIVKVINTNKPVLVYDTINQELYIGNTDSEHMMYLQTLYGDQGYALEILYDYTTDKLTITSTEENYLTDANAPKMYRHQMTITNQSNVSVEYTVYASNNSVIDNLEKFIEVTKADSNYTGLASYQDADGNVKPAYIRYSFGNVVIQVQNGSVSPMKSVSDIVTEA